MFETKIEEMQPDLRRKENTPVKKARDSERETVMSMSAGGKNVSIVNNIKVSLRKLVDGSPNKNDRFSRVSFLRIMNKEGNQNFTLFQLFYLPSIRTCRVLEPLLD